jgi:tRNA/rRNA methyltransferase
VRTPALAALEKTWSGENYWFWARRVLRKLRHGIRRAHIQGSAFAGAGETPAVILMEPQLADNIGMVARAMANFGLDELRLVAPRDGWPNEKARIAASGANYVIDDGQAHPDLASALGDLNWVAATTARQRDLRKPVLTPLEAVAEMRGRIARGERCGILFGRERNGLETDEVAGCDALVMIPVNSRFASLNLAQSVLLLAYEWMRTSGAATLGRVTTYETPQAPGLDLGDTRPATKQELEGFFQHLEAELDRMGFFNPAHRRQTMVRNLRTMFTRMGATEQEVRTLRGIVVALAHGKGQGRKRP